MTKKYKWLIAGVAILPLTAGVVFGFSKKSMGDGCVPDGSCCADEEVCTCE